MADWQKIKTEYISTKTSYRKLAEKYGVHYKTIADRGKKENWEELRSQVSHKTLTKTIEKVTSSQADRTARLMDVSDLLLAKVKSLLEENAELLGPQSMKNISGVLKDLKEIQNIKSQRDLDEQDARIAKLRREAEKEEDTNTEVVITFGSGGKKEWAE